MSSYSTKPNPWSGIPLVGTLIDAIQTYLSSTIDADIAAAAPASTSAAVTQTAHGFTVGNLLKYTGTAYALAKADTAADAQVVGIVSTVVDANNFKLTLSGKVTGLSGLVAGSVYYLNPTTAGAMTTTEPTTVGQVSKPVFIATSTTDGYFINFRGQTVTSTSSIGLIVALGS